MPDIYIYIYICTNLPVDVIVRLPHPRSGDSQGQETFLAPSADKQTHVCTCIYRKRACSFRYVENVFPGDYGIPRPFYFPFQPSYWCGTRTGNRTSSAEDLKMHNKRTGDDYEEEPEGVEIGVEIENLRKVFKVRFREMSSVHICSALRDLVPICAIYKEREKHPQRSVTFIKVFLSF